MDERQLAILEANGYTWEDGGIVDAEGNYVKSVKLGDNIFESFDTEEVWKKQRELKNQVNDEPLIKLAEYEEDPINNTLDEETYEYKEVYTDTRIKNTYNEIYKFPIVLLISFILYKFIKTIIKWHR